MGRVEGGGGRTEIESVELKVEPDGGMAESAGEGAHVMVLSSASGLLADAETSWGRRSGPKLREVRMVRELDNTGRVHEVVDLEAEFLWEILEAHGEFGSLLARGSGRRHGGGRHDVHGKDCTERGRLELERGGVEEGW